jgi:outer membrane protein assembly factor BamA
MRAVRETITHLISLNRFEDVQPFSEPFQNGVRLTWKLFPLHPVDRVEFNGMLGLSEGDLRRALNNRFSGIPSEGRANEAAEALRANYRRRGYPNARVTPRIVPTHNPDRATLIFDLEAGKRAVISNLRWSSAMRKAAATWWTSRTSRTGSRTTRTRSSTSCSRGRHRCARAGITRRVRLEACSGSMTKRRCSSPSRADRW